MGLYFYQIDCDAGTFATKYVCRQDTCLAQPKGDYDTFDACSAACGGPAPPAADSYRCTDGKCVAAASGVAKDVCESAC